MNYFEAFQYFRSLGFKEEAAMIAAACVAVKDEEAAVEYLADKLDEDEGFAEAVHKAVQGA